MSCTDGGVSDITELTTADGVTIALHDLAPDAPGGGEAPDVPTVLFSHATGFCAHVWEPVAAALSARHRCVALDYRGYGDSDAVDPARISWRAFGVDALTAAEYVVSRDGAPVVGVGHSMGGAALVSAALERPELFRALFLYEPIIFPPLPSAVDGEQSRHGGNALADLTRRRRSEFPSLQAALDNFASKPPLATFHPDARTAYVHQGFRTRADGSVELKCPPEYEARTYESSAIDPRWERLGELAVRCWVMAGAAQPMTPAAIAPVVAEQIPGSTFVQWDELGHFGPLEAVDFFAGFVGRTIATLPS